ncbi:pyocin knob domain-containing protein [Paenibacillus sp. NPDC058367]|uniref:pyocin knob domain-containing protein n=1 Tax=Paenibacillus sp. NPDC058367 TaxID=3346460 RepID=UPI003648C69F
MPSNTKNLNLYKKNPQTDGEDTFNIETMINENLDKIDAEFDASAGHKHTGAAGDGPKLTEASLAAGASTDTVIGDRTADPATAIAYGLKGSITQWFSWLTKYLKAITGKANPFDTPDITLAATKVHVDSTVAHITAAERTKWNAAEGNAAALSIPLTQKGTASGVAALDSQKNLLAGGLRLGSIPYYTNQAFLLSLAGTSNQKADIIISGAVHGRIRVTVSGAYAGVDARGSLVKVYSSILSPPNIVNSAVSRYVEATENLPDHISIGEIGYDSVNSRFAIPIEARSAYINTFSITVESWSSVRDSTFSLSPVYTGTGATTLPKAVPVIEDNTETKSGYKIQKHQLTLDTGSTSIFSSGSMDTLYTTGFYYVTSSATGRPPEVPNGGLCEVFKITGGVSSTGSYQRITDFLNLRTFIRYCNSNVWSSWVEIENANRKNVANGYAGLDASAFVPDARIPTNIARKGVVIADGTDLNSIAEGEYYCFGNVNAATMTNMPAAVAGQAFSLSVTKHAGYNQRLTTYIAGVTMRVFTRNIYNGVFSEWYELEHSGKKNAANGYAGLDSSAKVPRANTYSSLSGTTVTISNLDTLLTAGTYPVANTATGNPAPGEYGQVLVHVSNSETHDNTSNWIWQMFYGTGGSTFIRRKINNGGWASWVPMWSGYNDAGLLASRAPIANNTDYNTIITNGIYPIYQPTGTTNGSPATYGIMTVTRSGSGILYTQQEVMEVTTGNTYTRTGNGSTWTPWITNITSAGGTLDAPLTRRYVPSSYKYSNLASYFVSGAVTGTVKITLPVTWNNTMMSIKISGYEYASGKGAWELLVGGYNFTSPGGWMYTSAYVEGNAPFTSVRLAHDGSKCCILLGGVTSPWSFPHIEVSEVLASHQGPSTLGSGWTVSLITSETGITNVLSPAMSYGNADTVGGYSAAQVTQGTLAYAVTTGTAPTLMATFNPAIAALSAGLRVTIKAHAATTGPVTLNVNGLGAKSIKKPNGNNPPLALGGVYTVVYDGTAFILQGEGGEYGTATAAEVLAGKTIGTENGLVNGTMPDRTRAGDSLTYTTALSAKGDGFGSLVMEPQTGYYASGLNSGGFGTLLSVDPNFEPSSILSTRSIFGVQGSIPVITSGEDPALSVGKWGDGSLAVYPREGYRKGGPGAGEIKVTTAQLRSVEGDLAPANIRSGVEVFGVTGTLVERMYAEGYTGAHYSNGVYQISGLSFKPRIVRFTFFKENSQSTFVYLGTDTERWNFVEYAGTNPYGTVISSGEMQSPSSWGNGFSAFFNFSGISVNILWYAWR